MRLPGAILPVFSISAISGAETMTRSAGLPDAMASRSWPVGPTVKLNLWPALPRIVVDHAGDDAAHGAGRDDVELRGAPAGAAMMA